MLDDIIEFLISSHNGGLICWMGISKSRDCIQIMPLIEQNGTIDHDEPTTLANGTKAKEEDLGVNSYSTLIVLRGINIVRSQVESCVSPVTRMFTDEFLVAFLHILKSLLSRVTELLFDLFYSIGDTQELTTCFLVLKLCPIFCRRFNFE